MSFKDRLVKDRDNVFFNEQELAELANIEGHEVLVIPIVDDIHKRPLLYSTEADSYAHGVYQTSMSFFVRKDDLGFTPVENQLIDFNHKSYMVTHVMEDMGVFEITLESNES